MVFKKSQKRKEVVPFSRSYSSSSWLSWMPLLSSQSLIIFLTVIGRRFMASLMRFQFQLQCPVYASLPMSRIWTTFSVKNCSWNQGREPSTTPFPSINAIVAIGGMFTFPILNVMLIDHFGDFRVTFVIAGACLFLSSMALILARLFNKRALQS